MGADNRAKDLICTRANGLFPPTPERRVIRSDWQSANVLVRLIHQHPPPPPPPVDGHSLTARPLITCNYLPEQRGLLLPETLSTGLI